MKKQVWIIARKNIINLQTMKSYDDAELKAFDGILYGKPKEFDVSMINYEIMDSLKKEFETQYPQFQADNYELVSKMLE